MSSVERSVPASERAAYEKWLSSSSISTPDSDEMVIAWNVAHTLGQPPTAVIHALRGQNGKDAVRLRPGVETFVNECPDVEFMRDGSVRRTRFRATTGG